MGSRKTMPVPCSTHFTALQLNGIEKFTQTSSLTDSRPRKVHFTLNLTSMCAREMLAGLRLNRGWETAFPDETLSEWKEKFIIDPTSMVGADQAPECMHVNVGLRLSSSIIFTAGLHSMRYMENRYRAIDKLFSLHRIHYGLHVSMSIKIQLNAQNGYRSVERRNSQQWGEREKKKSIGYSLEAIVLVLSDAVCWYAVAEVDVVFLAHERRYVPVNLKRTKSDRAGARNVKICQVGV